MSKYNNMKIVSKDCKTPVKIEVCGFNEKGKKIKEIITLYGTNPVTTKQVKVMELKRLN